MNEPSYLTSYAQNFEDIILWRALHHVGQGNYIDIGAQSANIDSVSRLFYEQGWRGVHVDAMPAYADELALERPHDLVLCAAVTSSMGEAINFFSIPDTGLSTSDPSIAKYHEAAGFQTAQICVDSITLDEIFARSGFQEIHWLKVDIEGGEAQAIEGWSNSSLRPWIVVVESTAPLSQEPTFSLWEPELIAKGYRFAYFDGLNRFYVSEEHPELLASFGPGPNIFDNFMLSGTASAPFCRGLTSKIDTLSAEGSQLKKTARELQEELAKAWAEKNNVEQTKEALERQIQASAEIAQQLQLKTIAAERQLKEERKKKQVLREELAAIRESHAELTAQFVEKAERGHYWWITAENMRAELEAIYASRSWRWTKPLRRLRSIHVKSGVKRILRTLAVMLMQFTLKSPMLKRVALRLISVDPNLVIRLKQIAVHAGIAGRQMLPDVNLGTSLPGKNLTEASLSQREKRILADLDRAMNARKG
jgi:FkbM family methyltransferase